MDWLNATLLCLVILGHSTLWVAFINRVHARPWPATTLRRFRHLHEAFIVVFPFVVLWRLGWSGPGLLWGGEWSNVPVWWWPILAICSLGLAWLIFITLRRILRGSAPALVSNHSTIHKIATETGRPLLSPGPYSWLARAPFNQQWEFDHNEKTLQLERLPPEWDRLTILHLSDWHLTGAVAKEYFVRVSEIAAEEPVDLVCFTGDLLDDRALLDWVPPTLGRLQARLGCYFILGNHDWYQSPADIRGVFADLEWHDVAERNARIDLPGGTLEIAGDETPWMGGHPRFEVPGAFRLLLSHTPDNIRWAQSQEIDLMLSGHNHGGQVRLPVFGPIYSPSRFGCRYSAGTFWEPPTLLHVSRGLSGQHPLRVRCRPEGTRLVLRASDATRK